MANGRSATAVAHPNIAFIKYWGNRDHALRLPSNPSVSMNLDGLHTTTTVVWSDGLDGDQLTLNGEQDSGAALARVSAQLDVIRQRVGIKSYASVVSENNFPTGAGIASSASSFAALTLAAVAAAGAEFSERELTTLARMGSGSAARSVPTGFVVWHAGHMHEESFAESIAPPEHWNLMDVVALVSTRHKQVGSTEGHRSAETSDLQDARVAGAEERLRRCIEAVMARDFAAFAEVVEHDSNLMHAVMMTSQPPLFYWMPGSLVVMEAVRRWRADGLQVCYTLDAGPNVHCLCVAEHADEVRKRLLALSDVQDVHSAAPGGPALLVTKSEPSKTSG